MEEWNDEEEKEEEDEKVGIYIVILYFSVHQ